MSNKIKKKKVLTPELRFPEFRNVGEWLSKPGDALFDQISNKQHDSSLPILAITQEHGAIPRNEIDYHVFVSDASIESYKVVEVGDFIISLRSFQGGIEYSDYKGICSPAYVILRKRDDFSSLYFKHFFKTDRFISDLTKNIEGLRDGKMVSYKQFSELKLPYPSLKKEQQRIADFLSSMDDVIAVQVRKLEALKDHKKGLMQCLFPTEGETVPQLRFSEFRKSGKWEIKPLFELAIRKTLKNRTNDIKRVLTNSATAGVVDQRDYFDKDIANQANLDGYFIVEEGDYVYNPRISVSAPVGPISKNKAGRGVMSPLYTVFRFKNSSNDFYEQYFKTMHWHKYLHTVANSGARHDRMSITNEQFMAMPLFAPNLKEQQRIADCLSSLDEVIAAQWQKLEALKAHKKGLVQQLFPSCEEIGA